MSLSLLPLLLHHDDVPPTARAALRATCGADADQRRAQLELAARVLCRETDLDCAEARELVGLTP